MNNVNYNINEKFSGILKNAFVVSPENDLNNFLDIKIEDGIITKIGPNIQDEGPDFKTLDLKNKIIMPAFVEMHCHLREPGFEEKETIETGTESALAGGYAAICPMANTKPVNDNAQVLKFIKNGSDKIEILPICAVTKGLGGKEIVDFQELKNAGAIAFSNDGRPLEDMTVLKNALQSAAKEDVLIISHSEDFAYSPEDNKSEYSAVLRELEVVKETDAKYHFAHISTAESVGLIREAKEEGWNVTCETAPHYFTLSNKDIVDNQARFKMNPPLRSEDDVKAIIEGVLDGTIDIIATDHAPHTFEEKNLPFEKAPMGITGFETAFSLAYDTFVLSGYLTLSALVKKISSNPAKLLNLENQGRINVGNEGDLANLVIFDPEAEWCVEPQKFKTKCKISPFEGMKLKGKVIGTISKGILYGTMTEE